MRAKSTTWRCLGVLQVSRVENQGGSSRWTAPMPSLSQLHESDPLANERDFEPIVCQSYGGLAVSSKTGSSHRGGFRLSPDKSSLMRIWEPQRYFHELSPWCAMIIWNLLTHHLKDMLMIQNYE